MIKFLTIFFINEEHKAAEEVHEKTELKNHSVKKYSKFLDVILKKNFEIFLFYEN